MTNRKRDSGRRGEDLALNYLQANGYQLLKRNYRHGRSEIDLIMQHTSTMVFVEVKFRTSDRFGHPENFVTDQQQNRIISAADAFIHEHDWVGPIRFDIVAIDSNMQVRHFIDAFY